MTDQTPTLPPSDAPEPQLRATSQTFNTLAIVGFIAAFFVSLVGIVVSSIALKQIRSTGERGRGLAIGGIVVGALTMVVSFFIAIAIGIGAAAVATNSGDVSVSVGSSTTAADCTELESLGERAADELDSAVNIATPDDVGGVADKVAAVADDFQKAAADVDDQDVAAAARGAATALAEFASAMNSETDSVSARELSEKAKAVVTSVGAIGDVCNS